MRKIIGYEILVKGQGRIFSYVQRIEKIVFATVKVITPTHTQQAQARWLSYFFINI